MPDEYDIEPPPVPPPQPAFRPPPSAQQTGPAPLSQQDQRLFAMLCHLLGLAGLVIPFGNVIGPLVMWLVKREQSDFVDDQGKEAVNFQITMTIVAFGLGLVLRFAAHAIGGTFYYGYYAMAVVNVVFVILAATAAHRGVRYRYPLAVRLIS